MFNLRLQLLLGTNLSKSVSSGPTAIVGFPSNREVLTVSTAASLSCTSVSDTSVEWWVNGAFVSTLTPGALNTFTGTWTPGVTGNVTAYFKGNVTGNGVEKTLIVDTANTQTNQNFVTSWTKSNVTVTNADGASGRPLITIPRTSTNFSIVVPSASGSARRLMFLDPVSPGAFLLHGMDVWVGVKTGSKMAWLSYNPGGGSGVINPITNDNQVNDSYCTVVEGPFFNYQGSGYDIARVQFRKKDNTVTAGTNCFFDFMGDANNETYTIAAGADFTGAAMLIGAVRRVNTIALPFDITEKMGAWLTGTNKGGVSNSYQYAYKHQYVDSIANIAGGPSGVNIDVIYPTGYNKALGTGKLLLAMKAQTNAADTATMSGLGKTTYETMTIDTYADRHNCVVVIVDERPSEGYWNGVFDDGTKNMDAFIPLILVPWLMKNHGISPLRKDRYIWGWSKAGNAAMKQMLKYPTVWGFGGAADAGWNNVYPANNAGLNYNSAATYNANDPKQILASLKGPLQDKTRFVLGNGFAWNVDLAAMQALMTSEGVPYNNYTATWAAHANGPTGTNNGWTRGFVDAVMALS